MTQYIYFSGFGCGKDWKAGGAGVDVDAPDVLHPPGVPGVEDMHHTLDVLRQLGVRCVGVAHSNHRAGAGVCEGELGGVQAPIHLLGEILGLKVDLERKPFP